MTGHRSLTGQRSRCGDDVDLGRQSAWSRRSRPVDVRQSGRQPFGEAHAHADERSVEVRLRHQLSSTCLDALVVCLAIV